MPTADMRDNLIFQRHVTNVHGFFEHILNQLDRLDKPSQFIQSVRRAGLNHANITGVDEAGVWTARSSRAARSIFRTDRPTPAHP